MFLIYNTKTFRVVKNGFPTERGAKIAMTRKYPGVDHAVVSLSDFRNMEPMVERTNLMSGKKYMEPLNTPNYCSPSSEAYWSM